MDMTPFSVLSVILAVLLVSWLVTIALAPGAFNVRRHHPHHYDEERKHQH